MLVDKSEYLSAGIHIGMKSCTNYMKQFVYKIREDGLCVFNLQEVDNRITGAIGLLSKYKKILIVSHKEAAMEPVKKFAELVGGKAMYTRFSPGTLTNPSYSQFYEPDIVIVVDPTIDRQAIEEAKTRRVPIVGLCGTTNSPEDVDFVIPINNNSKKALALFFWLVARGIQKNTGKIKSDEEFRTTLKDFGDVGKPKKTSGAELNLDGNLDVDIDIEIEKTEKKPKKTKAKIKGNVEDGQPKKSGS